MITRDQIAEIGKFNKPHGISGEISATFDFEPEILDSMRCIVVDENGIFVPFFIASHRPKNNMTTLLTIDGVKTEEQAKHFMGKDIFALKSDISDIIEDSEDEESAYSFIGYDIATQGQGCIGKITDVEDSTDNYLFIVTREDDSEIMIPIADEYIADIDDTNNIIYMELPEGLLEI